MPTSGPSRRRDAERGVVLIWTLAVLLVLTGLIAAGIEQDSALDRSARMELAVRGQARAVAEAGVVDAYAWFRRQQVQPVTTFAPRRDIAASPPVNETDDPTVGLVREYEIAPNLWGRYEVRLTVPAESFIDGNGDGVWEAGEAFTDTDGNGHWDDVRETHDVSLLRGLPSAGSVWLIVSHGILFNRPRADLPLGTAPNDRISASDVATEIRRLTVTPPSAAAICATTGSKVTLGSRAAVAYSSSSGSPTIIAGAEVTGTPATTSVPSYDGSIDGVFGVPLSELKSMSDVSTSDPSTIGAPIGEYTLNVVDGDITFDETRPLRGTGVVVVLGSCTIADSSNSFFNGLLWVRDNLTVRAPCYLRGAVVAGGTVDVRGTGGDYAEIERDSSVISELLQTMGQYRHSKSLYVPGNEKEAGK
jgi:hypothetical protein